MKPNQTRPNFWAILLCLCISCHTSFAQTIPVADAGPDQSICEGQSAQLTGSATSGTSPYYFTWWCDTTNATYSIDSLFDDDPMVTPTATTQCYLQVVDQTGQISATDSVLITVNPVPVVDAGQDLSICPDSAPCVTLVPTITNAPGPYTYSWFPGPGLNDPSLLNPCARPVLTTTYALQVFSSQGCTNGPPGTDSSAMVTVVVHPQPIADGGPDRDICAGDTTQLPGFGYGAGPLYDFQWSPGGGLSDPNTAAPLAYPTTTTAYTLTVWSNGCPSYADTVEVNVFPLPAPLSILQLGDTLFASSADSGNTYLWCLNGQPISGANDPFLPITGSGAYEAKQVSPWGCPSQGSNQIVGTEDVLEASPLRIFPNPFSDVILVESAYGMGALEATVWDMQGRVLWEGNDEGEGRMEIDLEGDLPTGLYLLRMTREGRAVASHLLMKK